MIGLAEKGALARHSLTLFIPNDVKPGKITLKAYDSKLAKGPGTAIFIGAWFYYALDVRAHALARHAGDMVLAEEFMSVIRDFFLPSKYQARQFARRQVIGCIAGLIGLPLLCLFFVSLPWLAGQLQSLDKDVAPWVMVGGAVVCVGLMLAVGIGAIALSVWRRAKWLDAVFAPLGLKGSLYMLRGRQFRGAFQGRQVDVRFFQGPTLEIYVATPLMTQFSVAEKGAVIPGLAQALGRQPVALDGPALNDLSVFALDADWTRSLLARPEAEAALARLMKASNWAMFRQVHLQPGGFLFKLYRNKGMFKYDITPDEGRQWLEDLITLASVAESQPAPQVTAAASPAEQLVQSGGAGKAVLPVTLAMGIALLVGIPLCGIALTVAILALAK